MCGDDKDLGGLGALPASQDRAVAASPSSPQAVSPVPASIPNAWAEHRLCYVSGSWAYFTNLPLAEQWGDDWDDAPYEHNAEPPYEQEPGQIVRIAWEGNYCTPDFNHSNSPWSVEEINSGATPWLVCGWWSHGDSIDAGATIAEFRAAIERHGGTVFFPAQGMEAARDALRQAKGGEG